MKASELIEIVQKAVDEYGDADIAFWNSDHERMLREVELIEFVERDILTKQPRIDLWVD